MTPAAYEARRDYMAQCEVYLEAPGRYREPDHGLLLVGSAHGPILGKKLVFDERDGQLTIATTFGSKLGPRDHRLFDPLYDVVIDLGVAFAGGISVNDNTKRPLGLSYARLKLTKMGAEGRTTLALDLSRVITGAGVGQEAAQLGDYHSLRRRDLVLRTNSHARRTRTDFLEAAAYAYRQQHEAAGINVTLEAYLNDLRWGIRLADRWHGADRGMARAAAE
ncbi:hypothetical protein [Methylobacterium sp. J-068]|uniref:hypothetical protein n=1 Tax=Methylobacterium sp. J-068 TaxID=2836649 RepID=UPI001FBAC5AD|nr:hypothetical protein [Methylobacterium sp. J-068]MCJ2033174.1 hypothetical protein [Methylobacterium sp. J-068]